MSRWLQHYQKHPFRKSWDEVKAGLKLATLDDPSVITSVEELGRLRKAVSYIDGILGAIDPELVPMSTWDNFHSQSAACEAEIRAFTSDRNLAHIQSANGHVDNLLTYVRPYMAAGGRTAKALRQAAIAYSESMRTAAESYGSTVARRAADVENEFSKAVARAASIDEIDSRLIVASAEFLGDSGSEGTYAEVKEKIADLLAKYEHVSKFHAQFFDGADGTPARVLVLKAAADNAIQQSKDAASLVQSAANTIDRIREFENKLFGEKDESGSSINGLEYEISQHRRRLDDFEEHQCTRYTALNTQIESLLPGAASAGLASAYGEMKGSFDAPVKLFGRVFYAAIGILLIGSLLLSIESVSKSGFTFVRIDEWNSVLRSFAYKVPFYLPVVWLAYYASKRRSECQRLQQEYAHKEALAKSYDSYKKQIVDLGLPDNEMLISLMSRAIEAISHNASQTLDGKHGDRMPVHEIVEQLGVAIASAHESDGLAGLAKKASKRVRD